MSKVFYDRSGRAHTLGEKSKKVQSKSQERPGVSQKNGSSKKRKFQKAARGGFVAAGSPSSEDRGAVERRPAPRGLAHKGGDFKKDTRGQSRSGQKKGPWAAKADRPERPGKRPSKHERRERREGFPAPRPPVQINPDWIRLKGVVDKNKKGSAFLVFDRADLEDVFIPRYYTEQLFHGDRVEVFVNEEGEIEDLKVLEHRFKEIFGRVNLNDGHELGREFKKSKAKARTGYLIYERKKAKEEVYLPTVPPEVKEGDWVKAEMVFGDQGATSAKIIEHIGPMLPASYDIQMVAGEFNLKEHHTFDAVKQAESYSLQIPGKDEVGRTDLRHIPFFTIDGERARDFDDAVYVERLEQHGYRLWVAIADVSHYVKEGTPLDSEAYARATSVYFPERAFHMLPRALSEELCSLKPNVPRLSMACSIDYSREGVKGDVKLYDAIIESRRRATYTEIEAEKAESRHKDMFDLYRILKKARHERGSIDFDFPESEIILDEKSGEPSDIVVRERNDAHRLIEEFMIAANESVTEWMISRKLPFVYRIHEEPSLEAIEKFRTLARNMGVQIARGGIPRPSVLAEFIRTLKDHPAEPVLATALLRSMRQAIYSASHGEHYGLASEGYTHFTSPIRRYPDLIVHRLLRAALHRENQGERHPHEKEQEAQQERLNEMADHCSYRERVASDAEREAIRFKQIRMMAKNLGNEIEGKVNGLMEKGMFIQLWHPYCEGMVPIDSMKDDRYEFNEERMVLFGRRKRKTFTIGLKVKIRVVSVDLDARRVEFQLVEE
jgi:ribonuclease R